MEIKRNRLRWVYTMTMDEKSQSAISTISLVNSNYFISTTFLYWQFSAVCISCKTD